MALTFETIMEILESNIDDIQNKLSDTEWLEFISGLQKLTKEASEVSAPKGLKALTDKLIELCGKFDCINSICFTLTGVKRPGAPGELEKKDIKELMNRFNSFTEKIKHQDQSSDQKQNKEKKK